MSVRVKSIRQPDGNIIILTVRFHDGLTSIQVDVKSAVRETDERFGVEFSDRQFTVDIVVRLNELEYGSQFAASSELTEISQDVTLNDFIINTFPYAGIRVEVIITSVLIEPSSWIEENVVMFDDFFGCFELSRTFSGELKEAGKPIFREIISESHDDVVNVDIVSIRSNIFDECLAFIHGNFFFTDGEVIKIFLWNDEVDEPFESRLN